VDKNLLKTKPLTDCKPTEDGWVDAKTGELLVAIKNLKSRLGVVESIQATDVPVKRGRGRPKKIRD
jgi:hypothetical protein